MNESRGILDTCSAAFRSLLVAAVCGAVVVGDAEAQPINPYPGYISALRHALGWQLSSR